MSSPDISVIIPVRDGGDAFESCLAALQRSAYQQWEGIVVDDGSSDDSGVLAQRYGMRVFASPRPGAGPALARNHGAAQSSGEILFFLDADVVVRPNTLAHVAAAFDHYPEMVACFGSYDDEPGAVNFLSQYRNLQHHFVHQSGRVEATTFWSGCGAIRRAVFVEMDGFSTRYGRASIEDIELGYRLCAAGYQIRLLKSLQVKHLKRWPAGQLLLTDIRDRALPWSRLMLERAYMADDLNLQRTQRVSGLLALSGTVLAMLGIRKRKARLGSALSFGLLTVLNGPFYRFLAQARGPKFALLAWPWHVLYYLYSVFAFGYALAYFNLARRGRTSSR